MRESIPSNQQAFTFARFLRALKLAFEMRELDRGHAVLACALPALEASSLVRDARCGIDAGREVNHAERHEHHAESSRVAALGLVFDESPSRKANENHSSRDAGRSGKFLLANRRLGRLLEELVEELSVEGERVASEDIGLFLDDRRGDIEGSLHRRRSCHIVRLLCAHPLGAL